MHYKDTFLCENPSLPPSLSEINTNHHQCHGTEDLEEAVQPLEFSPIF